MGLYQLQEETYAYNVTDDYYTIAFTDSLSGQVCDFVTEPTSSCDQNMCEYTFEVSSLSCPITANILVTSVFLTNAFGDGHPSVPTMISMIRNGVDEIGSVELQLNAFGRMT